MDIKTKLKDHIFITGMPAVGKTYWGSRLAQHYELQFADLDTFIQSQEQVSIAGLFAQFGEAGFREKERTYLKKVIDITSAPAIIACGGGTPCFYDNMQLMNSTGITIYLQADIPWLINNMEQSNVLRPLLTGKSDIITFLEALLQQRKPFYEQAQYILPIKDISLITFDEIISSCINKQ